MVKAEEGSKLGEGRPLLGTIGQRVDQGRDHGVRVQLRGVSGDLEVPDLVQKRVVGLLVLPVLRALLVEGRQSFLSQQLVEGHGPAVDIDFIQIELASIG